MNPTLPVSTTLRNDSCVACKRHLSIGAGFVMGGELRCLNCSLRYLPLLRRSVLTGLVVGTVLVAINQGTVLGTGNFPPELALKVPLTYLVPFCVATWGALSNSRVNS